MKVADNVAMLEIQGMGTSIFPTLTWDDEHLVLIDTGFPGQTDAILQAVQAEGFSAENITHIILTHQDIDHIGCAMDLLKLAPSIQVLVHEDESPYIDGSKTPIKLAAMLEHYENLSAGQQAWCNQLKEGFANRRIPISQSLVDREVLPICGNIEVIHTPGHTPGHICLLLQESGILVASDALNIADGKLVGPKPEHTYEMELGLQSAKKAQAHQFSSVISYHCGHWEE